MIRTPMPSPIGHALGGLTAAWSADLVPGDRGWRLHDRWLTPVCVALAVAPDLDLLVRQHRTATHSIAAVLLVTLSAAAVAIYARLPILRVALTCGAAYATHLVLDWLAVDPTPPFGIQLFWPMSDRWYISGLDLFPPTERRTLLTSHSLAINAFAIARETLVLAPIAMAAWLVRVKALARLPAQLSCRHHTLQ